ncbi:MAG: hypothetical protein Q9160_008739 [Pyrenula sp. 1 TL-2023]
MPVTVYPALHESEPCALGSLIRNASPEQVLRSCTTLGTKNGQRNYSDRLDKTWSSSFETEEHTDIYPSSNGFVHAAIRAYNAHHHFRIRPDDVWIAILTQFSIYVNKNAEEMRSTFVAHQGKKALDIEGAILSGRKFDAFANKITEVLGKSVKDRSVIDWIMQQFSTTTDDDRITAGIIMMATFQSYFTYFDASTCGLPSVTLLGTREDWVQILHAIERLAGFGEEPTTWLSLLKPIISHFVRSFDKPTSIDIINFWQRIADYRVGGSGGDFLSGWLTAFCFWDEKGNCTQKDRYGMLQLDGINYAPLDWDDVPPGWASVPVEIDLDENGGATIRKCRLLAGSVGMTPFLKDGAQDDAQNRVQDEAHQSSQQLPKTSSHEDKLGPGKQPARRSSSVLHKLLNCCQRTSSGDHDTAATIKPVVPRTKDTAANVKPIASGDKATAANAKPAASTGDTAALPPYSNWADEEEKEIHIPRDQKPIHDYENSNADRIYQAKRYQAKAIGLLDEEEREAPPPEYRLDGLQPRVGWFLWQEEIIDASESEAYGAGRA